MDIKEALRQALHRALEQAVADGVLQLAAIPEVQLEVPPQKEFGDFATNVAMQSAKAAKANPRLIAQAVMDRLEFPWLERGEIAGPGFLNLFLRKDWLFDVLREIVQHGEYYGNSDSGAGQRVQVEFVSANPTGLLHVGHGRGAAVGSALVNLMRAAGYQVEAEYYINDAGNQIDNLAASVNARYLALFGKAVEFPADGYHGQDIIDTAKRIQDTEGDRYLAQAEADRVAAFKEIALQEKMDHLKRDLEAFRVHFDVWFSERTLHANGAITKACEQLKEAGYLYEQEGALWLKSTAFGDDKDRVVIRENGIPTYLAADIAYHRDKLVRGFDHLINIWGADHHGYICRVKAAIAALGYAPEQLEVLILQMVSLFRNGEPVKMSKRTGQSVTLVELMEEVGVDAARFFFVMRSIDSQLDFDLELAKSQTNENPVFYIQYAYARICSIFRQAAEAGIDIAAGAANLSVLSEEIEIDLIKKMADYPAEVAQAAADRAPHRIARYVHDLAGLFHTFYNQCRIIGVDADVQQARLLLVRAIAQVIKHALHILGVAAPERM